MIYIKNITAISINFKNSKQRIRRNLLKNTVEIFDSYRKSGSRLNLTHIEEKGNITRLKEILNRFDSGIPCSSSLVKETGIQTIMKKTAQKVVVKHCKVLY